MLEVSGLSAGYDGTDVIHDLSFSVETGEAVMIIGSNGAGKTTTFRAMLGLLPASAGTIRYDGEDISGLATHKASGMGISFVPAERHLFPRMTVEENLVLGAFPNRPDPARRADVLELFPRLAERLRQHAGTMSGGEQQMLAMGRALMGKPELLVLDEPTTGLAPKLAQEAYAALGRLAESGLTILVAEQQVPLAMRLCSRGYVLENGVILKEGSSQDLAKDPEVRAAYLGVS